jgi:hypothetical protein
MTHPAPQSKSQPLSLVRFLRRCCLACELFLAFGTLLTIAHMPFSEAMVANSRESVLITVPHGPFFVGCALHFGAGSNSPAGPYQVGGNISDTGSGSLSIGPIRLRGRNDDTKDSVHGISIRGTEGVLTITQPGEAARALRFVRWPFILSIMCTGGTCVALLDLFRRMLRSVERHEVFTAGNIRNVYWIGFILIASSIAKHVLVGWLVSRTIAFVTALQPQAALESSNGMEPFGIATGLMILAFAEILRQGLALKEENQLTI